MKKGLINIILLVLAITNIALTAIVVFAIVPAMNDTSQLVGKVAKAIDLEKEGQNQYTDGISIDDLELYNFTDKITVALKSTDKVHYAQFNMTLSLNKKDESYSTYKKKLETNESLMISDISNVVSQYTTKELQNNQEAILEEITETLRARYNNTTFIYSSSFVNIVFQ